MRITPFASPIHDPQAVGRLLEHVASLARQCPSGGVEVASLQTSPLTSGWEYTIPLMVTGGTEWLVSETYKTVAPPIILYHDGMNSLPATLETVSYYRLKGWNILLLSIREFFGDCSRYLRLASIAWRLRVEGVRLGLIGSISRWLIYSRTPHEVLERKGYKLIEIPLSRLVDTYKAMLESVGAESGRVLSDVDKAGVAYKALKSIIGEYRLDLFTADCFSFILKTGMTLCYPYSLLNSEGIVAGCEGDIPATIALHLGLSLFGTPGFMGNVNRLEPSRGELVLSHCTAPVKILREYSLTTHYETGRGVAVKGVFGEGRACILLRLSNTLDKARIVECYTAGAPGDPDMCRTRVLLKAGREAVEAIARRPMGNHYTLFLVDHEEARHLRNLLEVLGFETEVYHYK